jgi:hypothetical protein
VTAVLIAESIDRRYRNLLAVVGAAVPVVALEMKLADGNVVFTRVEVG